MSRADIHSVPAEALHAPAITLNQLCVSYRGACILHNVSGQFARGSLTAVVGANGCGKSTLLKSIAGCLPAQAQVSAHAVACAVPHQKTAYLAQRSAIDVQFPMSVMDCVLLGYWRQTGAFGGINAAMRDKALDALHTVGLQQAATWPLNALSSGQLQRVLFARLLLQDADLILLDEPFNAVDTATTHALLELVQQWNAEGRTIIAVMHDADLVQRYFPQTLALSNQRFAWGPTTQISLPVAPALRVAA